MSKGLASLYLGDLTAMTAQLVVEVPDKHEFDNWDCAISGDGRSVVYWPRREHFQGPVDLCIADFGEGILRSLPPTGSPSSRFEVSRDGRRIAWISDKHDRSECVKVVDQKQGQVWTCSFQDLLGRRDGFASSGDRLSISDDGRRLAVALFTADGGEEVFFLDLDRETALNVSRNPAADGLPCLAGGGSAVIFSSDRDRGMSSYLADLERGRIERVVDRHADGCVPWLTGDGQQLFYAIDGTLWRKGLLTRRTEKVFSSESENVWSASIAAGGRKVLLEMVDRQERRSRKVLLDLK